MKETYNQGKEPERDSGEISNENSSLGSFQTTSVPDSSTSFPPSFPPSPKSDFNQDVSQVHSQLTEQKTNKTLTTILIIIILLLLLLGAGYLYMQGFFSPDKEKKDKQTTEEVKADFSNMGDKAESSRTIGNVNDYSLGLITGGKERIHITEDGDIGIGTVNPGGLLGIGNNNTYITLDSQGNLTFTDAVSGTVKLSDLVSEEEETSETTKEELPIQQTTTTSTTVDYGDHRNEGYLKESEYNDGGEKKGKDRELGNKDKYDLEIITNNKTRLFVDKSGFIGIGTTDPDHLLDVDGNIGLGRDSYLNFGSEDGSDGYGIRDNNGNVQFKNKNGSWTDVGAGGIGTETDPTYSSSPASGITNTDINNWDTAYGWGGHSTAGYAETFLDLDDTPSSYTTGSILFTDNSSVTEDNNNLYWDNINKRLGIGTVSPSGLINAVSKTANANLHLHGVGDSHNYADIGLDQIDALGTTLTSWNITHRSEAGKDHNLEFLYYDGSDWIEPLIIDNNGNVGIGTTNPTQRLELHNDTEAAIALISSSAENKAAGVQLSADNGNSFWTFGAHHVDDKFVISDSSIATGDHLVINSNGNVGIGTTDPSHLLDVDGNIGLLAGSYINWGSIDGTTGYGFRDNSGTIEYKNNSGSWTAFDSLINPSLWTDGTNGYFSNTEGIIVGPDTTETLDNTGFSLNAGDLFVSDQLGVEGNIYTDGSFIAGNTLTLTDGSISQSTGLPLNINLGGNSGDDLLIDTDTLVVESDNNRVGINTTDPEEKFTINGGNYLHKAGDPVHVGSITDGEGGAELVEINDVYVSGKYAYVTMGDALGGDGLEILDISDPTNPTHVGSILDDATTELDGANGVYVSGKYAYITSQGEDGTGNNDAVEILDISDPTNPTHVGSILDDATTELDAPSDIYISGKYAYVTTWNDWSLEILDISDPTSPTHAGSLIVGTSGGVAKIYVQGNYAYLTVHGEDRLEIVDISDPTNPTHIGSIDDTACDAANSGNCELDGARGIYVSGKYAYVTGEQDDGLEIIDISEPANPTHVGSITDDLTTFLGRAWDVSVSGDYAYVVSQSENAVEVLDISDPANPTHVGGIIDDGTTELDGAYSIYISGKYAYVAGNIDDGLEILDISGIQAPAASIGNIATNSINVSENASIANDLYVNNGLMVGTGGILSSNSITTTEDLYINGGELYITGITSSSSTTEGTIYYDNDDDNLYVYADGSWVDLTVQGGSSLWTDGTNGYYSNTEGIIVGPDTTETLSNADFSLNAGDLFVSDQLGVEGNIYTDGSFIAGNTLTLTDGSISQSTGLPLNINLGGNVGDDLIIDTDTLVVESDNNRVGINTTDPEERFTINGGNYLHKAGDPIYAGGIVDDGVMELGGAYGRIFVQGKYAYVTGIDDDGLEILDISNPTNPAHVGAIDDATCDATNSGNCELDGANGVFVVGKYAYVVAQADDGLEILDISDPTNPTHVGAIDNGICDAANSNQCRLNAASDIYVSGKYAYVSSYNDDGLEIIDISDPTNPTHTGSIDDATCDAANSGNCELDSSGRVVVSGDYAYVTGYYDDGLEIIDISDPTNPTHAGSIADDATTALNDPMGLYVSGSYAYVASNIDDGLEIIDISDPTSPTHVGVITDDTTTALDGAFDVSVSGNYAYVASSADDNGIEVLDISDSTNPTHVGAIFDDETMTIGSPSNIYISGKYVYVAAGNPAFASDNGFGILDISGISAPAATIGDLNTSTLDVTENAHIANDLYVNNGLMVGTGGILSSGPTSTNTDLPTNYAATVKNDGNNTNRYGMLVSAGEDSGSGTLIQFNDGDGTDVGEITFSGTTTTYGTSSDIRMKENITSTAMGLEDLMKLQVRDYEFIEDESNVINTGFIAQELIEVFPHAVFAPDDGRMWSVDYGKITPLLAKAIQDQQGMIDNINTNYNTLTTTLTDQTTTNQEKFTIIGESITELTNELNNYQTETNNSLTTLTTTIENLNDLTTLMTDTLTNHEERIQNLEAQISNLTGNPIDPDNPTNNLTTISDNLQTLSDNLTTETIITTEIDPETGEETTTESYLFDVEGNLKARALITDRIETKEIQVDDILTNNDTAGKAIIPAGETETTIQTTKITEDAKVYITLTSDNYNKTLFVDDTKTIDNQNFTVKFSGEAVGGDVRFNWIILQ